ncbi:2-hydroxyglutaryl-CoA dehydratase/benzoyl-CoA reductase subunit [Thermotomaculum hydrothermale]|uniref:2-hydroxyglutaryl-CoA dehydratase/benzoyl-CoA reductase subunit n=1 Tax=Thermotomaculum hydrothermale TaxID=981385 RepID=A0A7R6PQM6_9BACT|nr:2-hydroxyacyl-CoA dehydratase family protein [Thermotomaculum hydrothermale]BBB33546.1 2-hydroxyglutaryl-CoA dehydratase/benzoyl-CoA reductase subunit [Thermotomaculum hydrothermale]
MNVLKFIRYYLMTNLIGKPYLKRQRKIGERKIEKITGENSPLNPPLKITAYTKEFVSSHYFKGRYIEGVKPVAWVTSGAPIEILKALGFFLIYPENHAALCGARRVQMDLIKTAQKQGLSQNVCSYVRTDIGSLLSGKTPAGKLPKPDLLVACSNICQTVLHWYRMLQEYLNIPLVIIDTPFVYRDIEPHQVDYVKKQLKNVLLPIAERAAGKSLKEKDLKEVIKFSKDATELWLEILNLCAKRPSPLTVFDQFVFMAPIVEMRGDRETVDFYNTMYKEVKFRVNSGIGAIKKEKRRLLWDNLPIWFKMRELALKLAEKGINIPISTYTYAWGELAPLMDLNKDEFEVMARVYLSPILNRGAGHKLKTMADMVKRFNLDGVILHSDRSCKPYSMGQMDQRNKLIEEFSIPAMLLEADQNDENAYSEEQTVIRIESFFEMLGVSNG